MYSMKLPLDLLILGETIESSAAMLTMVLMSHPSGSGRAGYVGTDTLPGLVFRRSIQLLCHAQADHGRTGKSDISFIWRVGGLFNPLHCPLLVHSLLARAAQMTDFFAAENR